MAEFMWRLMSMADHFDSPVGTASHLFDPGRQDAPNRALMQTPGGMAAAVSQRRKQLLIVVGFAQPISDAVHRMQERDGKTFVDGVSQ